MLLVFQELRECLLLLEERAQGLAVKLPSQYPKSSAEGVNQLALIALRGKQGREGEEQEQGAVGQPSDVDSPHVGVQWEGVTLGKRTRADSRSGINHALKRVRFMDGVEL